MKHRLNLNSSSVRLALLTLVLLVVGLTPLPQPSVDLRVASKKFTESVILGDMLQLLAESRGLNVAHYRELGGTRTVYDALVSGEIDAYTDYVGTITEEIFAGQDASDEEALHALLRERGIGMSRPLGFNNTYALAMTRGRAAELGVSRISDLVRHPELRVAVNHEFLDRGDGWRPLTEHYGLPQRNVVGVDHDIGFQQLLAGEVDVVDVYSTEANIRRFDLAVLEDDLKFFPRYDAVCLYRLDLDSRYPQFVDAMRQIEGAISEPTIQALNDEVEQGLINESQAAAGFLESQLGIDAAPETSSWAQMVTTSTIEHLDLVRRSLIPGIVVGIALGIFCQRSPAIGRVVLVGVGLLQTIPSLALLVLLMPLVAALGYISVGPGSVTAIVALFCYCLLPIVRNTYTGIHGIQRGTIESATALGLGPAAQLTQIELPIALPMILAGIRTSGVQTVGFATLGAIIGAGGLGQLILRGIRLSDLSMILSGAIPAALLALLLQLSLDLLEWAVVPRGLKRGKSA